MEPVKLSTSEIRIWKLTMPLPLMLLPNFLPREVLLLKESRRKPLLLVSIQPCLPKPRLKHRLKLKLKLLPNPELVPLLKLPLLLPLRLEQELMPLPTLPLNISPSRSLKEELPSTFLNRELELNASPDKLPRFNIPVPLPLTVRCSIHPSQEDSQLLSLLVR